MVAVQKVNLELKGKLSRILLIIIKFIFNNIKYLCKNIVKI